MVSVRNVSVCCFEGRLYDPTGGLSADNACDPSRTKRSAYPLQVPNLIARRSISPPSFNSCQESLITLARSMQRTHSLASAPFVSSADRVTTDLLIACNQRRATHQLCLQLLPSAATQRRSPPPDCQPILQSSREKQLLSLAWKSELQRPAFEPSRYLTARASDHLLRVEIHTEFLAQ